MYELLDFDERLTEALRRGDADAFARAAAQRAGFRPLIRHAIDLAADGVTSIDEALRLSGGLDELLD